MNDVIASVYAFPGAEHFAIGRRHERKFWGAHAKIEGIYFWAALPGAQHLERCFAIRIRLLHMTRRAFSL